MGEYIAPRAWARKALVVLGGYVDGSNLHTGVDIVSVAGCVADTTLWPLWEEKWKELLVYSDLPRWHHTDFIAKRYKKAGQRDRNWDDAKWLVARRLLCEAFEAIKPILIGATVRVQDYEELRNRYPSLPADPYYFLLDRCMHRLIQGMFQHPKDDGILIYCDQDKEESLVLQLSAWHTDYLHATASPHFHPENKTRQVVTSYGSNLNYIPLQAADVFAHELMRFTRANPDMTFIAINRDTGSFILDRLRTASTCMAICLKKGLLEMELSGTVWAPGHPGGYRFLPGVT